MRIDSARSAAQRLDLPGQAREIFGGIQAPEVGVDAVREEGAALQTVPAPHDHSNYHALAQDAATKLAEHFKANPSLTNSFYATLEYIIQHTDRMYIPQSIVSQETFREGLKYIRDVLKNSQDAAMIARADHEREERARSELAAYLMGTFRDSIFAARRFIDSHLDDGLGIEGGGLQSGSGGGGQQGRNRDQRDQNPEIPSGVILKK